MVFSNIRTILPNINFRNPKLYVQAKKKPYRDKSGGYFDTIGASIILEMLLNYYYKELNFKRQIDKALMDALIGPWGIVHIGYTTKTEKVKDGDLLEINEIIKEESPFAVRISPLDFRVDPEAKDSHLEDASWDAVKWVKSLDDIKRSDKYKNTAKLKSNFKVDTSFEGSVKSPGDDKFQDSSNWDRVAGWDIWDKKTSRLITLVETHDKFLYEDDWPLVYEGFPQEILYFNENPDEMYPVSDIEIYQSEQDELNRIRSLQLEHIKKISQRKYISQQNMLSEEEKRKITHGPSGTIAESTGDPERALIPIKDASVSQDIYLIARMLKEDIREESGIPQFEQGIAEKFDTATEPALMAQATQTRKTERLSIVENFVVRIMRKFAQVLQQTMSEQNVPLTINQFKEFQTSIPHKLSKISGPEAEILLPWFTVNKDDIAGEYDFDIEVGSMQPVNQEQRKRDASMMYQMFSQDPYFDPVAIRKKVLEAFEIRDLELKDAKTVQEEQIQMAQLAHQAEIDKGQPKIQADLAKTKMKTQSASQQTDAKTQTSLKQEQMKAHTALMTALISKANSGKGEGTQ